MFIDCLCPTVYHTEFYSGCVGDGYSVTVGGNVYDNSNPTGMDTLYGASFNGCDSVVSINLSFFDISQFEVIPNFAEIIEGDLIELEVIPSIGEIQWIPADFLSCDTCSNVTASPEFSTFLRCFFAAKWLLSLMILFL